MEKSFPNVALGLAEIIGHPREVAKKVVEVAGTQDTSFVHDVYNDTQKAMIEATRGMTSEQAIAMLKQIHGLDDARLREISEPREYLKRHLDIEDDF